MAGTEEERRAQILDSAQHVFAEKGYHGASIKDLARAAGVSPGLLYWYFRDKVDLFTSLLTERIASGFGELTGHISFDLPPEEFLPQFGKLYLDMFSQPANAALLKMLISNASTMPDAVRRVQSEVVGRVIGTLQRYFEIQIELGRVRRCNTEMAARTFMGGLLGYLLLRHILRDERAQALPLESLGEGIADVVLHGVLPDA